MKRICSISTVVCLVGGFVISYYMGILAGLDFSQENVKIACVLTGFGVAFASRITWEIIKEDR